jgi:hypothetical protein
MYARCADRAWFVSEVLTNSKHSPNGCSQNLLLGGMDADEISEKDSDDPYCDKVEQVLERNNCSVPIQEIFNSILSVYQCA